MARWWRASPTSESIFHGEKFGKRGVVKKDWIFYTEADRKGGVSPLGPFLKQL